MVDPETVKKIGRLARLPVKEADVEPLAADMRQILEWIDRLQEVDVEDTEPFVFRPPQGDHPLRGETAQPASPETAPGSEVVTGQSTGSSAGFFVVPKVVE